MITIEKLYEELGKQIAAGNGSLLIAFGDCNKLHLASGYGTGVVVDTDEYYLEEVHPDDQDEDYTVNVFIIGE
ncbi:hypothetical protein D3C80_768930 [compost metagenome]